MSSETASIFAQGNGLQPRGTLTSKWLGRRQGVKAAAMEIALSLIPIWHSCRRLWDPVVSVMPTARVCSVKSFPTGHGLEPVLYLSPVALLPLSLSGMTEKSKVRSNVFLTRSSPVIVSTGSSFLTADAEHGNNLPSTFFLDFTRTFLPESSPSTASTSTI